MPRKKLTEASVSKVSAPEQGRVDYSDTIVTGLVLRVTATGHRSWSVAYKFHGKNQRLTLGAYPAVGLKEAREQARQTLERIAAGENPAAEKKRAKREPEPEPAHPEPSNEFSAVVAEFIERYHKPRNRSWKVVESLFANHVLPRWQGRDITTIKRRDIHNLLDDMAAQGYGTQRNRVLAAVRKLFNWAEDREIVAVSPARSIIAPAKEQARKRKLSEQEMRDLWAAFDQEPYPFRPMFQLCLLTAQRRGEVAAMRWSEIDLDAGVWTIPGAKAKNGDNHDVPLSRQAVAILEGLPRFARGDHVFSTKEGASSSSGFGKSKARCAARANAAREAEGRAPMAEWRLHDLRRTAATSMGNLGIPGAIIGHVLNHSENSVTSIYNKASYFIPKRNALQAWGDALDRVLAGEPLVPKEEEPAQPVLRVVSGA